MYVGRFAPSPTGPLHFGSLVAALASWLDARAAQGRWLVRIEDLDAPRLQPGAAHEILRTLERLRLYWDDTPVFQSQRLPAYRHALEVLRERLYWCGCSRKEIADSSLKLAADGAHVYPGTCRMGLASGRSARALRIRIDPGDIVFEDRLQGLQVQDLSREVGDFVLSRADGFVAYQLAVVVDDAAQGVTDVVRGADLMESTARQIFLQRLLGYPQARYLHVPVALNAAGEKLSKQTGAPAVDSSNGPRLLVRALEFLGQRQTENLADAVRNWRPENIPHRRAMAFPGEPAARR